MRKSSKVAKKALLEFLQQHERIPTASGFLLSQLLNNRQIRTTIDTLLPSPAHILLGQQTKLVAASMPHPSIHNNKVDDPCYTLYFGPNHTQDPRWIPAVVVKRIGTPTVQVQPIPRGGIWRRHIDRIAVATTKMMNLETNIHSPHFLKVPMTFQMIPFPFHNPPSASSLPQSPANGPGNLRRPKSAKGHLGREEWGLI